MNCLHIIQSLSKESGGPAESVRSIVEGYLADGHTAEVATLDPPDCVATDLPVSVHALGTSLHGYTRSPLLRKWLRANAGRFQVIVVEGLWRYPGLAALQELAGRHRYAVFTHGMLDPWFNRTYPLKALKKLPYWLAVERRVLAKAHRVLFTSSVERDLAQQSFPFSRWTPEVIPFGTAGPPGGDATATSQIASFYERFPAAAGEPFLLFAGRLHPKKGCDLLLQAYAQVARDTRLPRIVMAGPDQVGLVPQMQAFAAQAGIADRILWPAMLTGDAKWGAFRAAEAFVLPSHQENFGIAVAEALSCGTPVLISREVNIFADVLACGAGLAEPDTLQGTIALLRQWAAMTAQERGAMSQRAMDCWSTHFNSAGTSRAIIDIFSA